MNTLRRIWSPSARGSSASSSSPRWAPSTASCWQCGATRSSGHWISTVSTVSTISNIYLQAGEEPGPALHHGGRARHLDLQQPQAEELRSHALETSAQLKIEALSTGRRPIQGGAFSVTKNFNMDPRFQLKLTSGAGGGYCPIALWMVERQKINIAITV